ncbi:hypothetical protein [Borrelia sp. P9F1]|uniref:hypothetical protein n=1 Tax=Borrelia sp. P9F1 TaxID=3058374 RepID=UPI00264828F2|nr:hypothetical protein [Borrelia sp. P9F1]WKC58713.1 hypothetical protein QYZ68_05780 [Borrelia sp. P9F1]
MKMYRMVLILLVIFMSCGQQTTDNDKIESKTGRKGKLIAGNKKRPNQKELKGKIDEEIVEVDKNRDEGKIEKGTGKGEKVKDTLYEALKRKVKPYRSVLAKARSKFVAGGYAFPDGLNGREVVRNEIERGERAFPNILDMLKYRDDFQTSDQIDKFYASLDYDVSCITKLEEIFSKLLTKTDRGHFDPSTREYKVAYELIDMISDIGYWNTNILYVKLSDERLNKIGNNEDLPFLAEINEKLDKYMEAESKLIKLIKAQIHEAAGAKSKDDMREELHKAAGYKQKNEDAIVEYQSTSEEALHFLDRYNI